MTSTNPAMDVEKVEVVEIGAVLVAEGEALKGLAPRRTKNFREG